MSSIFNVENFLNSTTSTALSTERKLIPPNTYQAVVEKIDVKAGTVAEGASAGKPWARLDVTFEIADQTARDFTLRSKLTVTYGVMLDLTEDGTMIDEREGRNVNLGKLYQALGINEAGANVRMLVGRQCQVRVEHGSFNGNPREEVRAVTKL